MEGRVEGKDTAGVEIDGHVEGRVTEGIDIEGTEAEGRDTDGLVEGRDTEGEDIRGEDIEGESVGRDVGIDKAGVDSELLDGTETEVTPGGEGTDTLKLDRDETLGTERDVDGSGRVLSVLGNDGTLLVPPSADVGILGVETTGVEIEVVIDGLELITEEMNDEIGRVLLRLVGRLLVVGLVILGRLMLVARLTLGLLMLKILRLVGTLTLVLVTLGVLNDVGSVGELALGTESDEDGRLNEGGATDGVVSLVDSDEMLIEGFDNVGELSCVDVEGKLIVGKDNVGELSLTVGAGSRTDDDEELARGGNRDSRAQLPFQ